MKFLRSSIYVSFLMLTLLITAGCGDDDKAAGTSSQASTDFTATLDGAQEVPAVATAATGTGAFVLNADKTELTFDVTVTGLSGAIQAAHFHNGATGANGGVVRTLTSDFTNNTASGTWSSTDGEPLTPAIVTELEAGRLYVNVHTAANPAGEIRGQVLTNP